MPANTTTARGYGHTWRTACTIAKQRKPWTCTRCGNPIPRTARWPHPQSWSGGHPGDGIAANGTAVPRWQDIQPEHLGCNTSAGGRTAAQRRRRPRTVRVAGTSVDW